MFVTLGSHDPSLIHDASALLAGICLSKITPNWSFLFSANLTYKTHAWIGQCKPLNRWRFLLSLSMNSKCMTRIYDLIQPWLFLQQHLSLFQLLFQLLKWSVLLILMGFDVKCFMSTGKACSTAFLKYCTKRRRKMRRKQRDGRKKKTEKDRRKKKKKVQITFWLSKISRRYNMKILSCIWVTRKSFKWKTAITTMKKCIVAHENLKWSSKSIMKMAR